MEHSEAKRTDPNQFQKQKIVEAKAAYLSIREIFGLSSESWDEGSAIVIHIELMRLNNRDYLI